MQAGVLVLELQPRQPGPKACVLQGNSCPSGLHVSAENSPSENTGGVKTPEVVGPPPRSEQPHWQPVIFHRRLAGLASRNAFDFGEIVILFALIRVNASPPSLGPPWKAREPPSPGFSGPRLGSRAGCRASNAEDPHVSPQRTPSAVVTMCLGTAL
ncbi:hypothetical protein Celaphus_00008628 [Cervus elaphus hippelaphus]|uniref:Uncharacterized protein n=1 Tax=Cervus elaphus hippelaphus TaxID=46360 RepID=A0A212CP43_CEREH|nr:hypothetical protein Celaphus_00008628 [Cervus elaphus hippelaphus]